MQSTTDHQLRHLLAVLGDRNIPLTRDNVQWAFESPKTRTLVGDWFEEHLGHDTLLTKEELDIYSKLEEQGQARDIQASQDLSLLRPVSDSALQHAIKSLQSSTLAIERQSKLLTQQREALARIQDEKAKVCVSQAKEGAQRARRYTIEARQIERAADDLFQTFSLQSAAAQQQVASRDAVISPMVAGMLKADDKVLSELERLAKSSDLGTDEDDAASSRVKRLCEKLITFVAEGVRLRLDRIYLDSLQDARHAPQEHGGATGTIEIDKLQEEVETLYSEIGSVADMSIQQTYLHPLLRLIRGRDDSAVQESESTLEHTSASLQHLSTKLDVMTSRIKEHHLYREALSSICDAARDQQLGESLGRASSPTKTTSPTGAGFPIKASKSPMRSVKGISADDMPEGAPIQRLFRQLAVSLPPDMDAIDSMGAMALTTSRRKTQLQSQIASMESSIEATICAQVDGTDRSLRLLLDALYADSPFSRIHLIDQEMDARVGRLQQRVEEIGDKMAALDLAHLHQRDVGKEHFTARWTG